LIKSKIPIARQRKDWLIKPFIYLAKEIPNPFTTHTIRFNRQILSKQLTMHLAGTRRYFQIPKTLE